MRTDALEDLIANLFGVVICIALLLFGIWFVRNENPKA